MHGAQTSHSLTRRDNTLHVRRRDLFRFRSFRTLITGQFLSQIADAATTVILAGFMMFGGENGPTISRLMKLVVSTAIPLVIAGPLGGYLADKSSRRHILIYGQISRSLIMAFIVLAQYLGHHETIFILWSMSMCSTRVIYTGRAASIRHLVRRHELVAADSLSIVVSGIAGSIGATIGLGLSRAIGFYALIGTASLHLLAGFIFTKIRRTLGGGREHTSAKWHSAISHSLSPKTRYAILSTAIHRHIFGLLFATTVLISETTNSSSSISYTTSLAICSLGMFLGSNTSEWVNEYLPRRTLTTLVFSVSALVTLLAMAADFYVVYSFSLFMCAFLFQNLRICSEATVQSNAISGAGGREFAIFDLSHNLSFLAGIFVGLVLHGHLSIQIILCSVVTVFGISSLLFAMLSRDNPTVPEFNSTTSSSTHEPLISYCESTDSHDAFNLI